MGAPIPSIDDWQAFERYARRYFSDLWGVDLQPRSVAVGGSVPWKFDLVSADGQYVGDAKSGFRASIVGRDI